MKNKIVIEQHISFNKCIDLMIYKNEKLVNTFYDISYTMVDDTIKSLEEENKGADIKHLCFGELCVGGWMTWEIDANKRNN